MSDLQKRVADWHRARFPQAQSFQVGFKLAEEAGEVAEALNYHLDNFYIPGATSKELDVTKEAADVVIVLMVLLDRWFDTDLLEAVEEKLAMLTNPKSGHRAALSE